MDGFFFSDIASSGQSGTAAKKKGVEKYPGNPLSDMQGRGKRKLEIQHTMCP